MEETLKAGAVGTSGDAVAPRYLACYWERASWLVSGAAIMAAAMLIAFALWVMPAVREVASIAGFALPRLSASFYRWGPWPVVGAAGWGVVLVVAKDWLLDSVATRLVVGILLLAGMLVMLAVFAAGVLAPLELLVESAGGPRGR